MLMRSMADDELDKACNKQETGLPHPQYRSDFSQHIDKQNPNLTDPKTRDK